MGVLNTLERKTGVPKFYLTATFGTASLVLLFFGLGAHFLCNFVGFVYPATMSFRAIETNTESDTVQWLTYWMLFAFMSLIECFSTLLLSWFPFYYAFKM